MGEVTVIHLSRLIALERRIDTVANNVANAGTTGFRSRQLSFQEYLSPAKESDADGKKERPVSLVNAGVQIFNTSQGPIEATGNPLDLAIAGDGYFVVQTPQGERYSRAGAFTLDNSGRLVTLGGQTVLSRTGPIQIAANEGPLTVASDGTLSSRQRIIGSLRLVKFNGPVQADGGNLVRAIGAPIEMAVGSIKLTVGALERSNVQTAVEMSRLSEVTQSYQLVATLLKNSQNVDDLIKLGAVPE